ncbi:branched-chain amino acid ABC transporter permease [Sphaerisporangium melleum]|uniref:Branched-chain amino acid ABC transporter permease n=1 Tax=Sphaerisporangium melleum TaxID=321316 RepID=A0A917VVS9_9ACTN|nr:AzlC family ABC transporter permease [Sphaerisporangium melleum]GGL19053.1 branched-chain amino acid ABC transporter permease [Sphaerisporangium melleum]GII71138.1 branched-chain amino acid ABC transporter permease [Sphaerisporangium melleum]
MEPAQEQGGERLPVIRDAVGIGLATSTYGLSFGALAATAGLDLLQTCALSSLMFTGASQFAMVGVIAAGGNPFSGAAAAALLGARNGLYGLHLAPLLRPRGRRRLFAAQFVIDESAAMTIGRRAPEAWLGFWAAGLSVFAFWNLATLLGALGARALSDPSVLGLDVVAPAAFLALLAPRMTSREPWLIAALGVAVALLLVGPLPPGLPILAVACAATVAGLVLSRGEAASAPPEQTEQGGMEVMDQ